MSTNVRVTPAVQAAPGTAPEPGRAGGDASGGAPERAEPRAVAWAVAAAALLGAAVVWWFHTRSWYGPDEGAYAYVAERLGAGARLNGPAPADVQDIHLGYVNYLNGALRSLLGSEMVRLRWPLIALGATIAACTTWLLRGRRLPLAAAAGVTATLIGIPIFLSPSANWYAAALASVLAVVMSSRAVLEPLGRGLAPSARVLAPVGAMLGLAVGFRQLSGIHLCLGALGVIWMASRPAATTARPGTPADRPASAHVRPNALTLAVGAVAALAVLGYLLGRTNASSWPLFALGPIAVLTLGARDTSLDTAQSLAIGRRIGMGALAALAPLMAVHLAQGTAGSWLSDTVTAANGLAGTNWIAEPSTLRWITGSVQRLITAGSPQHLASGAFWLIMMSLGPVLGARVAWTLATRPARPVPPVTVLAVFFCLVSAHYQVPGYAAYTAGLSLAGHLALARGARSAGQNGRAAAGAAAPWALLAVLVVGALAGQAGQAPTRPHDQVLSGEREAMTAAPALGAGLRIPVDQRVGYEAVLEAIDQQVPEGGSFLDLTISPELYVLSGTHSPLRWWNPSFGLMTQADRAEAIELIRTDPPPLVIMDTGGNDLSDAADPIVEVVRDDYRRLDTIGGWDLWVPERQGVTPTEG
ncbi:MAG: hypothetical protein R2754_14230 [Microthrixaceae bacterium]